MWCFGCKVFDFAAEDLTGLAEDEGVFFSLFTGRRPILSPSAAPNVMTGYTVPIVIWGSLMIVP